MSEDAPNTVPAENEAPAAEPPKEKPKMSLMAKLSKGRKKKITALLLSRARTDLQIEADKAEAEKQAYIKSNVQDVNISSMSTSQLRGLCEEFQELLRKAEGEKFDMEIQTKRKDLQIASMRIKANETRGKFNMPTLKAVKRKPAEPVKHKEPAVDLRSSLKKVEMEE